MFHDDYDGTMFRRQSLDLQTLHTLFYDDDNDGSDDGLWRSLMVVAGTR